MLLLIFASLRVLMLEDEMDLKQSAAGINGYFPSYLVGRTTFVRTEHDHIGRSIREFLSVQSLVVLQQLHIGAATLKAILELDLVLHNQILALGIDFLGKFRRDCMMSSRVLDNKAFIS